MTYSPCFKARLQIRLGKMMGGKTVQILVRLSLAFCDTNCSINRYIIQGIHKKMVRFQKLTRNLFLTSHGHNVHSQQRQLSKFLMCYQQFTSHAYCGAAGPVSKMASQQERAFCVLRFEVSRSLITVHREFRARFRKDAACMVRLF